MSSAGQIRVLLGPQSPQQNIAEAVAKAELPAGPLAVISAAWQEAEGDIDVISKLLGRQLEDLYLYRRGEELMANHPELEAAARLRQHKLMDQQRMYRIRLKQLSIAARHMLKEDGDSELVASEQRHAIAQLRALDRHHLHRSESIWRDFNDAYNPDSYPELARQAQELGEIFDRCAGIVITGGNVAILINRMRLFGIEKLLDKCNIVAWSAGAMALAERVVLFHDRSPEGRRDAEVLGAGCGVIPGYVFLPNTKQRLRTGDKLRVELLSRRFSPDTCVALDNGAELRIDDAGVRHTNTVRRLNNDGRFVKLRAA